MLQRMKKIFVPIKALQGLSSDFHVEMDRDTRGIKILVSGVKNISELSDNLVVLKCAGFRLSIKGEALSLSVYEEKTLEISGRLEVVEFENSKN